LRRDSLALQERFARPPECTRKAPHEGESRIVGWFYADPSAGLDPTQLDIAEVRKAFARYGGLFLLVNPAVDQAALYTEQDGNLVPIGGFYEAVPHKGAPPVIPWSGEALSNADWG